MRLCGVLDGGKKRLCGVVDAEALTKEVVGASAALPGAAAAALGISDAEPPFWSQQLNKASNVIFNSGVVALLRAWTNPPRSEVCPLTNAAVQRGDEAHFEQKGAPFVIGMGPTRSMRSPPVWGFFVP